MGEKWSERERERGGTCRRVRGGREGQEVRGVKECIGAK